MSEHSGTKINILDPDERMIIKKKGIIDINKMYADIYKWFKEKQYEFQEHDHKYKATSPLGEEHELHLYAWRKENDFFRWEIYLRFNMWDMQKVVVEHQGKKKTMYQCRLKAWLVPYFVADFGGYFEKSAFLRKLGVFWIKTVLRYKWMVEGDKFEYEFHELHELLKKDLDMYAAGNQFAHFWK